MAFGAAAAGGILALRADPAVGSFALSLVPACALTALTRSGPWRLLNEVPAPGLVRGTALDGTPAAELLLSPWLLAAPVVVLLAALVLLRTPFGLRLRAYGETPALAAQEHGRPATYRVAGAAIGGLCAAGAAALQLRAHSDAPPLGLGLVALGCAIAGRWAFVPGVLLAAGPALLRALRPYAGGQTAAGVALDAAPFLVALLYLVLFSRRALRLSAPRQARLDPDVL
jgi:simple sugar transport system permease protein